LRAREAIGLGLRQKQRSIAGIPKTKLAIRAAALLAGGAALAVAITVIARGPAFPLPSAGLLPTENSGQNLLLDYVSPELVDGRADADQGVSLPPAPVTLELSTYTVRSGDSLASIAKRFGLNMDTIVSANGISSALAVKIGAQLRVPNINGLIYKVRPGDQLVSIAKRYKIDTTRIVDANDLGSSVLVSGQSLFIPGARLPDSAIRQALGPKFAWPIRGPLSSYFGYRPDPFTGVRRFHAGIDIVVDAGTPIHAAMDGRVADVGYNANFGNYIILSHADGFQTLYGHLTSASVAVGDVAAQGAAIGISGNTGYSTGPHLHFGLYKRSLALNPLKYLK
jgi:murein DD-endopeptidase MepM/ murein hydrolase activator NlpD